MISFTNLEIIRPRTLPKTAITKSSEITVLIFRGILTFFSINFTRGSIRLERINATIKGTQ